MVLNLAFLCAVFFQTFAHRSIPPEIVLADREKGLRRSGGKGFGTGTSQQATAPIQDALDAIAAGGVSMVDIGPPRKKSIRKGGFEEPFRKVGRGADKVQLRGQQAVQDGRDIAVGGAILARNAAVGTAYGAYRTAKQAPGKALRTGVRAAARADANGAEINRRLKEETAEINRRIRKGGYKRQRYMQIIYNKEYQKQQGKWRADSADHTSSYDYPQAYQGQYDDPGMLGSQPTPSEFSSQQTLSPYPPQQPVSSQPAFDGAMPQRGYSQPQLSMRQPLASSPKAGPYGAYRQQSPAQSQQRPGMMTPPAYTRMT